MVVLLYSSSMGTYIYNSEPFSIQGLRLNRIRLTSTRRPQRSIVRSPLHAKDGTWVCVSTILGRGPSREYNLSVGSGSMRRLSDFEWLRLEIRRGRATLDLGSNRQRAFRLHHTLSRPRCSVPQRKTTIPPTGDRISSLIPKQATMFVVLSWISRGRMRGSLRRLVIVRHVLGESSLKRKKSGRADV